jgi:hypothetical protein
MPSFLPQQQQHNEIVLRIAAYCRPENKVSLGFVEGLNNKIRVFQRRAYVLKDEEYLRLKVLSCMLPGCGGRRSPTRITEDP